MSPPRWGCASFCVQSPAPAPSARAGGVSGTPEEVAPEAGAQGAARTRPGGATRARARRPGPVKRWLVAAVVGAVWWNHAAVSDGGLCARAAVSLHASLPGAENRHRPAFAARPALAPSGAGRPVCTWPGKAQPGLGRSPAASPSWPPLGWTIPSHRIAEASELHLSLSYMEDDEEVKNDYRRADEDGSRIFLSGLSPSVDEKRLILAMQSFEGVLEVKLAKPGYQPVVSARTLSVCVLPSHAKPACVQWVMTRNACLRA